MDKVTTKTARPGAASLVAQRGERELIARAFNTLHRWGVEAVIDDKRPATRAVDYLGTVRRGAKRARYQIEVQRTLRPASLGPLLLRLKNLKPPALILTDYVTPQVATLLHDAGIAFADAAGNAYLRLAGDVYYVVGNQPERSPRAEKVVRAFHPAGIKVLFALLCMPELVALPTRELAVRLSVANGTVGRVIGDLAHLGFITTTGQRDRRLHNLSGLLERWAMMYPAQLRPALLRRRLSAGTAGWWEKEQFDARHVVLGGEPAADRLTGYLKPALITLYTRGEPRPLNEMIARHGLRNDPNGNVEVLEAFWPVETPAEYPGLAPTPLVYADLLASGNGRALETAKRIFDERLAKRFAAS